MSEINVRRTLLLDRRAWVLGSALLWGSPLGRAASQPASPEPATITSDSMEVIDNGAQTIFTGHVVLTQAPYQLVADRMTRTKATGIVDAEGHIRGTWIKPSGEKLVAEGQKGRYDADQQITELWGKPKLTRWETERDTAPVVITARRFIAHHEQKTLLADQDVHIRQGDAFRANSDKAEFEQETNRMKLWGSHQTVIYWENAQGKGRFLSDEAFIYLKPREARLINHVTGHVIPAP